MLAFMTFTVRIGFLSVTKTKTVVSCETSGRQLPATPLLDAKLVDGGWSIAYSQHKEFSDHLFLRLSLAVAAISRTIVEG